jgi:hypothetical protein
MSIKISEIHIRLRCDMCNDMHLSTLNTENVLLKNILIFKYLKNILPGTNPRFKNSQYSSNIKQYNSEILKIEDGPL